MCPGRVLFLLLWSVKVLPQRHALPFIRPMPLIGPSVGPMNLKRVHHKWHYHHDCHPRSVRSLQRPTSGTIIMIVTQGQSGACSDIHLPIAEPRLQPGSSRVSIRTQKKDLAEVWEGPEDLQVPACPRRAGPAPSTEYQAPEWTLCTTLALRTRRLRSIGARPVTRQPKPAHAPPQGGGRTF